MKRLRVTVLTAATIALSALTVRASSAGTADLPSHIQIALSSSGVSPVTGTGLTEIPAANYSPGCAIVNRYVPATHKTPLGFRDLRIPQHVPTSNGAIIYGSWGAPGSVPLKGGEERMEDEDGKVHSEWYYDESISIQGANCTGQMEYHAEDGQTVSRSYKLHLGDVMHASMPDHSKRGTLTVSARLFAEFDATVTDHDIADNEPGEEKEVDWHFEFIATSFEGSQLAAKTSVKYSSPSSVTVQYGGGIQHKQGTAAGIDGKTPSISANQEHSVGISASHASTYQNDGFVQFSPAPKTENTGQQEYKISCGSQAMLWLQTALSCNTTIKDKEEYSGSQGATIDFDWNIENVWTLYKIVCAPCNGSNAPPATPVPQPTTPDAEQSGIGGSSEAESCSWDLYLFQDCAALARVEEHQLAPVEYVVQLQDFMFGSGVKGRFVINENGEEVVQICVLHRTEDLNPVVTLFEAVLANVVETIEGAPSTIQPSEPVVRHVIEAQFVEEWVFVGADMVSMNLMIGESNSPGFSMIVDIWVAVGSSEENPAGGIGGSPEEVTIIYVP